MTDSVSRKRHWKFAIYALLGTVLVVSLSFLAWRTYMRWEYPYGWSHCCDLGLSLSLETYAHAHGGRFPAGEATPEASLSLLYRAGLEDGTILRGKTVPESVVREILERGELLGPETCGWHYVEGLTINDNPRLAIFWDKVGLGHNGQRLPKGGHNVMLVGGFPKYITEEEWPAFEAEQGTLLLERNKNTKQPSPTNAPTRYNPTSNQ
jgi:hypothetical protein